VVQSWRSGGRLSLPISIHRRKLGEEIVSFRRETHLATFRRPVSAVLNILRTPAAPGLKRAKDSLTTPHARGSTDGTGLVGGGV
jgi:hypothetical protein